MSTLSGGPNIVTNGLVLYLDAANSISYVSGSTMWNDLTRNGNNGVLTNGPTFSNDNGGSIVFDGVDDYTTFTVPFLTEYTFTFWLKYISLPIGERQIFKVTGDSVGVTIYQEKFFVFNGSLNFANQGPEVNKWYNLSVTRIGSITNIFINGLLDSSFQTGRNLSSNIAFLASNSIGSPARYSNMNLSIFALYNISLSSNEILKNYNATKSRFNLI